MSDIADKIVKRLTNESLQEEVKKLWEVVQQTAERNGNMAVELAAMTHERDALRREVAALVGLIVRHVECVNCPRCEDECGKSCGKSIRDWAKQAAQAGKDGEG